MGWRSKRRGNRSWDYGHWAPYVSVAERKRQAGDKVASLTKKGEKISPVTISGKAVTTTFWGKAWCENLESYMDYANRLPRGRSYVRNGSVIDLQVTAGMVKALVSGSSVYRVEIAIKPLEPTVWQKVSKSCAGKIDSLVELLQGRLSNAVMETVTSTESGLFPEPRQISMKCSCPDSATMCKHVAATLYGVGNRFDAQPELLFLLRQVDHLELIAKASVPTAMDHGLMSKGKRLGTTDLGSMFGIEIDNDFKAEIVAEPRSTTKKLGAKRVVKKRIASKVPKKKTAKKSTILSKSIRKSKKIVVRRVPGKLIRNKGKAKAKAK